MNEGRTIAEAAGDLGVSERTLRRLLSLARFTGRTVAEDRQTARGRRRTTLLPPALLADLRAYLEAEKGESGAEEAREAAAPGRDSVADSPADSPADTVATVADSPANAGRVQVLPVNAGELPAAAYREIIARLERENARLWEALRQEQEAARLAQENLTREQTLRALPPPQPEPAQEPQQEAAPQRSWWPWKRKR